MDGDGLGSEGGDGLQILPAQYSAQTSTAGGPLIADDSGVFDKVFSGRADAQLSEPFLPGELCQFFLALARPHAPKLVGIVKEKLVLVDFQPAVAAAPALEDQGVIACLFQMESKAAAAVGGGQNSGLGRQGGDIKPGGAGRSRPGQRAGGNHHPVFLTEWVFLAGQMIAEDPGGHDLAAKIQFPLLVCPGIFGYGLGAQIHQHDLSHIACVF